MTTNKTTDPLARWWWPIQWLRIVYAVWIDQVWYWQFLRPRLNDWWNEVKLLIQGTLGVAIVVAVLLLLLGKGLEAIGIYMNWSALAQYVILMLSGSFFLALIAIIGEASFASRRQRGRVVASVTLGLAFSIMAGIYYGIGEGLGVVGGFMTGVGLSMSSGVVHGTKWGVLGTVVAAVVVGLAFYRMESLVEGIIGSVAFVIGIYLGGYWSTRQIADTVLRKRLANPQTYS